MAIIVDVTSPQLLSSPVHPGIPPELSDRVIDFLHDDWTALKACSLTCKAWLPASRFHLWNRVVLRYSGDGTDYAEFLKASPAITSCIIDLTVEFPIDQNNDTSREAEAAWMAETLIPIFSTLRILQRLMFVGADFGEGAFLAKICSNLPTANVVQLSMCHFSKFSHFVELVWSCPSLENLRLDAISFDQVDAYIPRPPSVPRPELKFLMIVYCSSVHMPVVIDWLVSEGFCIHVDFLVVFQQHIESPAITRLLPAVGSNLRHLSVSYAFLPTAPDSKDGKSVVPPLFFDEQNGCDRFRKRRSFGPSRSSFLRPSRPPLFSSFISHLESSAHTYLASFFRKQMVQIFFRRYPTVRTSGH